MTQVEVAEKLNVSFQAVSKWENGTVPNVEVLMELSRLLNVSVDTLLTGGENISYEQAGINLKCLSAFRKEAAAYLTTDNAHVMKMPAASAALCDMQLDGIESPLLVMSTAWPGSKCRLAAEYGYNESIGCDMVNDLVCNIVTTGAKPLAVMDCIVSGDAQKETLLSIVKGFSEACKENDCALVGGSTCIQPQTVRKGAYTLSATMMGIISRNRILDGSAIREGDVVLAVESNGPHTAGYTLLSALMEKMPQIKKARVDGKTFIEQIMQPHASYYKAVKPLLGRKCVHGMAHVTIHGGIKGNLGRLIPEGLCAEIDLNQVQPLPIFSFIKRAGNFPESKMLVTFNCGVGMCIVVSKNLYQ